MKKVITFIVLVLFCYVANSQPRYAEITIGSGFGFTTVDGQQLLEMGQTYSYNYFMFGWNLAPSKAQELVYGTGNEMTPSSYELFGGLTLSRHGEKIYPVKPYIYCGVQVIDYYYKDLYYGQRIKAEEKEKNFTYGAGIHFQYPKNGGGIGGYVAISNTGFMFGFTFTIKRETKDLW